MDIGCLQYWVYKFSLLQTLISDFPKLFAVPKPSNMTNPKDEFWQQSWKVIRLDFTYKKSILFQFQSYLVFFIFISFLYEIGPNSFSYVDISSSNENTISITPKTKLTNVFIMLIHKGVNSWSMGGIRFQTNFVNSRIIDISERTSDPNIIVEFRTALQSKHEIITRNFVPI